MLWTVVDGGGVDRAAPVAFVDDELVGAVARTVCQTLATGHRRWVQREGPRRTRQALVVLLHLALDARTKR